MTKPIIHLIHDFPARSVLKLDADHHSKCYEADQRRILLALTGSEYPVISTDIDVEDWVEHVVRAKELIKAATNAGAAIWGLRDPNRGYPGLVKDLVAMNDIAQANPPSPETTFFDLCTFDQATRFQLSSARKKSLPMQVIASRQTPYATNSGFIELALRRFFICQLHADEPSPPTHPALSTVIKQFAGQIAVWKHVSGRQKAAPVEILDFSGKTPEECDLTYDFAMGTMHLTGLSSIQDYVEMHNEYRVFIVNGVPVAGAGCVEKLTPFYATSRAFSSHMEPKRNAGNLGIDIDRADRYRDFASRAAFKIAQADPLFPKSYVIDLFETNDGEIGVIEINPLLASGLFATNYGLVAKALIEACQNVTETITC